MGRSAASVAPAVAWDHLGYFAQWPSRDAPRHSPTSSHQRHFTLRSARVATRKRLGQHLLRHPETSEKIVELAEVRPDDHVMEVGPGTGNLTVPLLRSAASVTAYELDDRMFRTVTTRAAQLGLSDKLTCVRQDVLRADIPPFDVCVANIPFQISSPLLRKLFLHRPRFRHAVIMFQAEFAERLMAVPGSKNYSRLTVNTQLLADVSQLMFIKRSMFRPPPKVDSIVAKIVPKEPPAGLDAKSWESMLRLCFMAKNKTLRSVFKLRSAFMCIRPSRAAAASDHVSADAEADADVVAAGDAGDGRGVSDRAVADASEEAVAAAVAAARDVLERSGFAERRPNGLSVDEYLRLYNAFTDVGVTFVPPPAAPSHASVSSLASVGWDSRRPPRA